MWIEKISLKIGPLCFLFGWGLARVGKFVSTDYESARGVDEFGLICIGMAAINKWPGKMISYWLGFH